LECPLCDGRGRIRSPETSALSIFRRIKSLLVKGDATEIRVTVPVKVAEYLLNNMRAQLAELESQYASRISILVRQALPDKEITVEAIKEETPDQPMSDLVSTQSSSMPSASAQEEAATVTEEPAAESNDKKPLKQGRRRRSRRKSSGGVPVGVQKARGISNGNSLPQENDAPTKDMSPQERVDSPRVPENQGVESVSEPMSNDAGSDPGAEQPNNLEQNKNENIRGKETAVKKTLLQNYLPFS
jgi:ribonuclease E